MSTNTLMQLQDQAASNAPALGSIDWLVNVIRMIETWRQRHKSRNEFAGISSQMMRDAGISSAAVFIEGNKPFWEA